MPRLSRGSVLPSLALLAPIFALSLLSGEATAQFNNTWLTLTPTTAKLKNPDLVTNADVVANGDEKDFAVGDVDQDGWPDLAIGKKVQVTFIGPREGRFFHNEKGVLVDRTAQYASNSNVIGDDGFKELLETRDVEFVDVTGDGWLDMVTCQIDLTNNTAPSAKVVTHPRIYRNQGDDAGGYWLGFMHEDHRVPQLVTIPGALHGVVRFNDLTFGDVDLDGDQDLYFADSDTDENGHPESASFDLNDRLLLNDGAGFFVDATTTSFGNSGMYSSAYGVECAIHDVNGDIKPDIVKISTLTESPNRVEVIYNDVLAGTAPDFTGGFDGLQNADSGENYSVACTDLNNDGRLDMLIGDAGTDHYQFNTGTQANGQVLWSADLNFSWLTGSGDPGFPGHTHAADYDLDGWNDALITDVFADLAGCSRRTIIYHNQGGTPGATNIVLREEKQQSGSSGWFGAIGWSSATPKGINDAANIDFDRDGDIDIILGGCTGTTVWLNGTNPVTCGTTTVPASLGDSTLSICGPPLHSNLTATLSLANGVSNGFAAVLADLDGTTVPAIGAQVMVPCDFIVIVPLDPTGSLSLPVPGGFGTPGGVDVFVQCILVGSGGGPPSDITNVVKITALD